MSPASNPTKRRGAEERPAELVFVRMPGLAEEDGGAFKGGEKWKLWADLDRIGQQMDETGSDVKTPPLVAAAVKGVSATLTAGFVTWLLRAGSMVASLLSSMPLWRRFDPLPIVGRTGTREEATLAVEDDTRPADGDELERLFAAAEGQRPADRADD
jgi:hypothetical protein